MQKCLPFVLIVCLMIPATLQADDTTKSGGGEKSEVKEELSETSHHISVGGQQIQYKAQVGTLVLKEENGKSQASIFYIAYLREGVKDAARRPITFSFNGGPGSSSVWLHLGLLGPKRTLMDEEGRALPPPYRLVDNSFSMLDKTDLVFIDPVTTGYSRAAPGADEKKFYSVQGDIESVGDFIRLYITRAERWGSPKFLIGESYGTTRAAGLSGYLQKRHGIYLNGIMLISSILNFQTARFDPGNDLPYILFLPTYTATAWYHKKLPADLQSDLKEALRQSEAFAANELTLALMKGAELSDEETGEIARKLARFTGLSEDYVKRSDLRVSIFRFVKELLRDQAQTVGRLDSRFTGMDRDAAGESFEYDPSYAAIQGPYTATLNSYVRSELKFKSDLPYEILTGRVWPWKFDKYENRYVDVAETLRGAMTRNPALRVFVANGYYDLATPYFATRYTFDHLGLPPALRKNISMGYYEAGHMMYIHQPSLRRLKEDLAGFISSALPAR